MKTCFSKMKQKGKHQCDDHTLAAGPAGLLTETGLDGIEDLISQIAVLVEHQVGLAVHVLSHFAVLQGLGVDEHVQRSSLQGSLAAHGAAAGIGNCQAGALLSEDSDVVDGLAAQLHDLHGSGAGDDGGLLHDVVR